MAVKRHFRTTQDGNLSDSGLPYDWYSIAVTVDASKMYALRKVTLQVANGVRASSATAGGHGGSAKFWKNLFFFGGLPCMFLGMINVYVNHEHEPRPEFIPYEYLRVRNKRFPWGDGNRSLFHNPQVNALPDGYEEEEHHH